MCVCVCVACTFILFNCVILFVFFLPVLWVVYVICRNLIWRAIISSATTAISYCLLRRENCKCFFLCCFVYMFCLHSPDKHTYMLHVCVYVCEMYLCIRLVVGRGEGGEVCLSIDFVCFLFHLPTFCGPEKPPLLLLLHVFFCTASFRIWFAKDRGTDREREREREVHRGR